MEMKTYKYPKTLHLPFSPELSKDDKRLNNVDHFEGKEVVVSLKMDGENTSLYPNYLHARSINEMSHASQDWIKSFHAKIKYSIPKDHRICGENLYAEHSIPYEDLKSFFYAFSLWHRETCLNWSGTKEILKSMGIITVPVIYEGLWDQKEILKAWEAHKENHEGFVVRIADAFTIDQFALSMAKYVRKNHVQTDVHWKSHWKKNKLNSSS